MVKINSEENRLTKNRKKVKKAQDGNEGQKLILYTISRTKMMNSSLISPISAFFEPFLSPLDRRSK